jgi:hypothetical protein
MKSLFKSIPSERNTIKGPLVAGHRVGSSIGMIKLPVTEGTLKEKK